MPVYINEKEHFWGNIENNTEYEKYRAYETFSVK